MIIALDVVCYLMLQDYSAGLSLYGDKAKPKTFAARFQSPDGYCCPSSLSKLLIFCYKLPIRKLVWIADQKF